MPSWNYAKLGEDENGSLHNTRDTSASIVKKLRLYQVAVGILLILNVGFVSAWWRSSTNCVRPQLVYSPAKGAIKYEKKRLFRDIDNNVYAGKPRPEHDEAWAKLIEPITIKVSQKELDIIGEESIALKDGSGFIAETAVYHELHCIKRIRRHLYLDHYYPNMTEDARLR
ncbi:hypothetical protein CC80DRAFT_487667, partial [Byssothecium circinans]